MEKELKELVMADLCARIPYGVKVSINGHGIYRVNAISQNGLISIENSGATNMFYIEEVKPYLLSLKTITKEKEEELLNTLDCTKRWTIGTFDWFNKNHYDYRGLLWGEIAIDATNLNIY